MFRNKCQNYLLLNGFFVLMGEQTVVGAVSPGGKQRCTGGGQREQTSAREVSWNPGQFEENVLSLNQNMECAVLLAHHFMKITWIILISVGSFKGSQRKSDIV